MSTIDSLLHPKFTGGLSGASGYDFEVCYLISRLPEWLANEELCLLQQETWSDVELFTRSGVRTLIQIKDHTVSLPDLREILESFRHRDNSRPLAYERYIIACCGTATAIEHLPFWLERIQDISNLTPEEVQAARADLHSRLTRLGLDAWGEMIINKVTVSSDCAWIKNSFRLRALFVAQIRDKFLLSSEAADRLFLEMLARLHHDRGKPIDLQGIRDSLQEYAKKTSVEPTLETDDFLIPHPALVKGRDHVIEELKGLLSRTTTIVIYGIPGIGKSTVAARSAHACDEQFCVLWFDCDAYPTTEEALYRAGCFLSRHLGDGGAVAAITNPVLSVNRRIEIAASKLDKHRCMLVWDGFSPARHAGLEAFIVGCMVGFRHGRQLVTAREHVRLRPSTSVPLYYPLGPLPLDDSIELLRHILTRNGAVPDSNEELFAASVRLGGHPLSLHLVGQQGHLIPLKRLVDSLPDSLEEVSEIVNRDVYAVLPPAAQNLLSHLSVVGHPFRVDLVDSLHPERTSTTLLRLLLERGVVVRIAASSDFYTIHEVVRDFAYQQLGPGERQAAHAGIVAYLSSSSRLNMWEILSLVPHALKAGLFDDLERFVTLTIRILQENGAVDLILRATEAWALDKDFPQLWIVHYARGKAFRFKSQLEAALGEYGAALGMYAGSAPDMFMLERTVVQMKLEASSDGSDDCARAHELYAPFLDSNDDRVRITAAGILGKVRAVGGDPRGLDEIRSALEQAERLLDEPYRTRALADLHYALGEAYARATNDYSEAARQLETSLQFHQHEGGECDLERLRCSYDGLMWCYRQLRSFDRSLQMARARHDLVVREGMDEELPYGLLQLAISQCLAGSYSESLRSLNSCLDAARAKRLSLSDVREWRTVALWCAGRPEDAFEEMYEYYEACAAEGITPTYHAMIQAPPAGETPEVSTAVGDRWIHMLELPPEVGRERLERWREALFQRSPHLRRHSNPLHMTPQGTSARTVRKIGRNTPCPCGSGKKSKKCCYR